MKLNSLFTGSIGRPKGRNFLGSQPTRDKFCHKKTKHFVTIEIFWYDVGNPLGSMHKKAFRTGRYGKCRNLRWNTKLIFFVMIDFFSRNKIVSNQSFPNKLKPKIAEYCTKSTTFLEWNVIWSVGSTQFAYLCTDCKQDSFSFSEICRQNRHFENSYHWITISLKKRGSHSKYFKASCQRDKSIMNNMQ